MFNRFFNKKNINASINYLELTPKRNYDHEIEASGKVSVLVPRFKNKFLVDLLVPRLKSPYIKAKLDEFGSVTWLEINGNNKVSDISGTLTHKFGDKIQPVNERLTKFLTQLYKYNFISFKEIN